MVNKIFYIANIRLPTEKAHGIQIMEMCKAFADVGFDVELVVPKRKNDISADPFEYHDIERKFNIKYLPCLDLVSWGRFGFIIQTLTFAETASWYSFFKRGVFYTRDELPALYLRLMGKKVLWEAHTGQKNWAVRKLIKLGVKFIAITDALKDLYISLGAQQKNILVAPDGADINRFNINVNKVEARKKLGIPLNKKVVLYKGHLYERKGAHVLAEATKHFEDPSVLAVFIGGTEEDVKSFKERFGGQSNILILGNKPRQETPLYQKASDVLVIPNSAKDDVSKLYTSPMKLFGYMAGNVPIVASDLPSLREIIDESMAYFFTPDDPKSLALVIEKVLNNYDEAKEKARKALTVAEDYSWQKRAKDILDFSKV